MIARLVRTIALMGVMAGFSLLLFGGGLWVGVYYSDIRLTLVLVGGLGAAIWLAASIARPELRPGSNLSAAFAASLIAFALCGAAAWQPRLGLDYLAYAVLLTALYLLLVRVWAAPLFARQLLLMTSLITVFTTGWYLVTIFGLWLVFWNQLGHFAIPPLRPGYEGLWLGNPNALASLVILLYLTSAAGIGIGSVRRCVALTGLGVLVAAAVFLTGSRGSWLGVTIAAAVGGAVWLASSERRAALRRAIALRSVRIALLSGAIVVAAVGFVAAPALASRLGEQAAETRTSFWAASVRMILDRPLTGLGPGAWAPARLTYTQPPDADFYIPHAHNVPLQVGAEFGLVGVVAAAVVVLLLLRLIRSGLHSVDSQTRRVAWAALLSSVYLSGQQLVDAYIHQPAILLALALPIAWLDARLRFERISEGRRSGPALAIALLGAVVVAIVVGVAVEGPAKAQELAVSAIDDGDWPTALQYSARAVEGDPQLAPLQMARGLALAASGQIDAAEAAFSSAASLDDLPNAWMDLAAVDEKRSDASGELEALDRAMRIGSQQPQLAVPGAEMYLSLGQPAKASAALAVAFTVAPSLARDPLWKTRPWIPVAGAAMTEAQAKLGVTYAGFMLALERDDLATATRIAAALPSQLSGEAILAARAWGGDEAAFQTLVADATARPLDVALLGMCRRTADVARTERASTWSCDGAGWTAYYPVIEVGPYVKGQIMVGPDPYPHAMYAFRRMGPRYLLVPWVTQVTSRIP